MAMAAPNQPLPGLQVTVPDEDMEISDYERNADDIDIDIDLTVDPSHHEDENMDDDRSERDSKDDVMLDGDGNDEDGMMQDNMSVPDEHLTDASDVGYLDIEVKEAPQHQPAAEQVDVQVQDSSQAEDFIDYDDTATAQAEPALKVAQHSIDQPVPEQNQFPDSKNPGDQETNVQVQSSEASTFPQASAQDQTSASVEAAVEETTLANSRVEDPVATSSSAVQNAREPRVTDNSVDAHSETVPVEPPVDSHAAAVTEDETRLPTDVTENQTEAKGSPRDGQNEEIGGAPEFAEPKAVSEQSAQASDEALVLSHLPFDPKHDAESASSHAAVSSHPVVVVYQGDEISLFPPHGSDTSDSFYFLHDESLANESIRSLLQACRQVLGETMRDEDELEFDIAELGLCVSEDSDNAASTSFSQVLDVYLQLHQLDGHESPGPLYMTLNTKTRFSARLDALLAAIADGRGMSQLSFLEDVTEEDAYVGSDNGPEEQEPANQDDEQDGGEHANNSIPEHASEREASQEEASLGKLHPEGEQEPESDSTAVQQPLAHVEDVVDAVSQDQGSTSQQNEESASTHQHEPQGYVSPKPEDLPEYESSEDGDGPIAQGNGSDVKEGSRVDASGPDYSRENDQINYDDGDVPEEARDDASLRSSTLQGDNTPAAVDEGVSQRESNTSAVPAAVSGAPHDESYDESREGLSATQNDETLQRDGLDTRAREPVAVVEENQSFEQSVGQGEKEDADDALEQELERELNAPPESFSLQEGVQETPDDEHFTANYDEGEEYGFEHDGDVQEGQDGEGSYEEFVVVEAEDAHENPDAPDEGQAADYQEWTHGDRFDDAEAEQTAENDLNETHLGLEQGLEDNDAEQAQPTAHASDEDELDTIDYDDEELSRSPSAQHDEAAAPSPSSGKRGWEELGQDDEDQADEQAPKKVKSE
ncbi:conserved glutamic acid-rich protein [Diplodia corticola]|uniref:Conserved glutamic acid-rich protein n=1 Tax=Diplodia corticola TaxID=236234 RepID=A0A1J9R1S9_9PEZI|nr:conserved glutamic acid-rich protein [Diplodia corticola]OJD34553.1 conserved glutamic acid-rich protein [Diplodia corticola]